MTDDYRRPDPDELLARIQAEEHQQERGKLKVFLGYAAGVGKTYSMLEAAHQQRNHGVDVLIAYVETHGRAETGELVEGIEVIPRRQVEYHGAALTEMDVDAVLERRPGLALVDELAHTNAPGSRHAKRYQDILELLDHGIDVYTTLNVQHLESLNDVVLQITGVVVRETVPDSILDEASEIELIDLPPDELLERLKEGKVYVPDQAARAIERFFRKGNLTALRELSMRRAAERVDVQMRDYMKNKSIPGPWSASERLLVSVSSHPLSERLVRAGRRLANDLNAEWFAVYIQTPDRLHSPPAHRERVERTLRLAEELGARVETISGASVPEALLAFAHEHNITKIIVGKPLRPRWREVLGGSIVDEIIRRSGKIDVYVISDESGPLKRETSGKWWRRRWIRYGPSILLVGLATLLGFPFQKIIHPANLVMLYLAAVVFAAVYLGRGPSMLASLLSVLAFDFFFVEPRFSFSVADTQYLVTFVGLLVVGLVVSNLAGTVRNQVEVARRHEQQSAALYALSRELTVCTDINGVLKTIVEQISQTFSREIAILLPEEKELQQRAASPGLALDENELAVAVWSYEHGQPAGRGTDTLPDAGIRYQPLKTARGAIGVMGVRPGDPSQYLSPEQRQMLDTYAGLAALAIERAQLAEEAQQSQVLAAAEKLQTALLNSVSHDLRTPLTSITGAFTSLLEAEKPQENNGVLDDGARLDLIENGLEEAERLNRLVGNLLDMTRLESGSFNLIKEPGDIQEVIGSALARMGGRMQGHAIKTEITPDLPLVPMDFVLIEQVLVNLLDNALKYSLPDFPIEINTCLAESEIEISIANRGRTIPPDDLPRIFDKFYRVLHPDGISGTGLGLSICKGIVEAHRGRIWARNHPQGGVIVSLALPLEKQ